MWSDSHALLGDRKQMRDVPLSGLRQRRIRAYSKQSHNHSPRLGIVSNLGLSPEWREHGRFLLQEVKFYFQDDRRNTVRGGKFMDRIISLLLAILLLGAVAFGQTNRGGINGTVFDKNGAVLPGATVTVTNIGSNRSQTTTASSDGAYAVPSLEPVAYRITVEAPGFKKSIVDNIKVDTASTATVNITLETGEIGRASC